MITSISSALPHSSRRVAWATMTTAPTTMTAVATSSTTVNLLDLAASAVASSVTASRCIREMSQPGASNPRLKEDGSFVTDADFTAQGIIVQALRRVSSQIRIVGEESPEEMARHIHNHVFLSEERINRLAREEMRLRYFGLHTSHAPQDAAVSTNDDERLPLAEGSADASNDTIMETPSSESLMEVSAHLPEHLVSLDRVSVFVDPLDGTKSYAHGDYDAVTVLVAIILDNYPYFGVICKPFGIKGQTTILDTGCVAVYGGKLLGGVYIGGGAPCRRPPTSTQDASASLPRAIISSSRSKGLVENFVRHLASRGMVHPEPFHISGAGEKSLRLILGSDNEALWFFPKDGTCRWDVAASDALLRAMGGKLTDKYGQELDYISTSRRDAANVDGIIASNDAALHAECIRLFQEGNWNNNTTTTTSINE